MDTLTLYIKCTLIALGIIVTLATFRARGMSSQKASKELSRAELVRLNNAINRVFRDDFIESVKGIRL